MYYRLSLPVVKKAKAKMRNAVASHRRRLKRRGIARVEVRVPAEDVALVRRIAAELADPKRSAAARATLEAGFPDYSSMDLKQALLGPPYFDFFEVERDRTPPRDVDLDE